MRHLLALLTALLSGCAKQPEIDVPQFIAGSAAILVLKPEAASGRYVLTEVLKNDGTFPIRHKVGDSLRLISPPSTTTGEAVIAIVGSGTWGGDIVSNREYHEFILHGSRIPGLNHLTLDELRTVAATRPNKTPEPTTTSVMPAAEQPSRRP